MSNPPLPEVFIRPVASRCRLGLAPALACAVVACTDTGVDAPDDLSGLPSWTVVRELEIGREDHPDYALAPVGGLAVAPDGRILLSQPQDRAIRVFGPDGTFLGRIGGPGDGPGEFLRLFEVGVLGDAIWAVDGRERMFVHFFDLAGRYLRSAQPPSPPPPYIGSQFVYPLADGGFLLGAATSGDMMFQEHEAPRFRMDAGGELVRALPGHLSPGVLRIDHTRTLADGRSVDATFPVLRPLSTGSWLALAPDHTSLVRAETALDATGATGALTTLRIARYTLDGETAAEAELPLTPPPVPEAVRDSLFEAEVSRAAQQLGGEARARSALSSLLEVPPHYPPLRSIVLASDGTVWMQLEGRDETRWLHLDAELAPTGVVDLPPSFRLMVAEGNLLWGVERDALEVPRVVRLRVSR